MSSTADSEAILHAVLDEWKAGVNAHEPGRVAARFTADAIFQGLHPYSVGRRGIAAYDESQPLGLTAQYQILETRRLADDLVLGYQNVEFGSLTGPRSLSALCLLLKRLTDGWYIAHCQVSLLP
jgi:ketosteroid isomerase-like protein